MLEWIALLSVGFGAGVASGWLAIGGGLVLFPGLMAAEAVGALLPRSTLLYSALSAWGGLVASITASILFGRKGDFDLALTGALFLGIVPLGLIGGSMSAWLSDEIILGTFCGFVVMVVGLLATSASNRELSSKEASERIRARLLPLTATGAFVGLLSGITGMGGAAISTAALHRIFEIPLRLAMGSALPIAVASFASSLAGKWVSGEFETAMAIPLTAGILVGVPFGVKLNLKSSKELLKRALIFYLVCVLTATAGKLIFAD